MVLQAIFNGAFFSTTGSSSTTLFIGSSTSTLVAVDSRHHRVTISFVAEEDALNGACPTEEKSDCLEAEVTSNRNERSKGSKEPSFLNNQDESGSLRRVMEQCSGELHIKAIFFKANHCS
ncbi:hypothetical protein JHK84_045049 [Glycine max]|nr:hypothetical protein JHK86_044995 [Glycine max]KAG4951697.1 hypothetical protein JHK85_045564 [Glycine max]KAG5108142.1 hypothetical protein JHK84_045049 [Glycine max]